MPHYVYITFNRLTHFLIIHSSAINHLCRNIIDVTCGAGQCSTGFFFLRVEQVAHEPLGQLFNIIQEVSMDKWSIQTGNVVSFLTHSGFAYARTN